MQKTRIPTWCFAGSDLLQKSLHDKHRPEKESQLRHWESLPLKPLNPVYPFTYVYIYIYLSIYLFMGIYIHIYIPIYIYYRSLLKGTKGLRHPQPDRALGRPAQRQLWGRKPPLPVRSQHKAYWVQGLGV